ncbi:hypothetical protein ACNFIC_21100 [Pseudomonas sp. NY15463]|uniref:hypothetical protein n=1 Tax=Pseudomonas sp. NY15463 TaxID=3400361 RepID=UPI003A86E1E2
MERLASSHPLARKSVTVVPESRFMQNYRVASAVHGGSSASAISNARGDVELFTSGSDTQVWNIYPDPQSATANSATLTGLTGEVIASGLTPSGDIALFAAQGTNLLYCVEQPASPTRWSSVKMIDVPLPSNAVRIARITTTRVAGKLYIGVLVEAKGLIGTLYNFSWGVWDSRAPTSLNGTTLQLQTLNAVWTGNSVSNVAFTVFDTVILEYTLSTHELNRPAIAANFRSLDVAAATDQLGNTQVLAILDDGNAYSLVGGGNRPYSWAQLTTASSFKQVAVLPSRPALDMLLLGVDNTLYHASQNAPSATGWGQPTPVYRGVQTFQAAVQDNGLAVFAIQAQQNTVTQLTRESLSGNWNIAALQVQAQGSIEDFASYSTDVTLFSEVGTPLAGTPVEVWTEEPSRLAINGGVYYATPRRPVRLLTNSAGVLSIAQQVSALAAPAILLAVPSLMSPGERIEVRQDAEVQDRLSVTHGNELLEAKLASGAPLLRDQYRTQATADAVAEAVNRSMSLASPAYFKGATATPYTDPRRPRAGVSMRRGGDVGVRSLELTQVPEQHWHLSVRNGQVQFSDLSADAASGLLMALSSSSLSAGWFSWLTDIGDFIAGVAQGLIEVVDYVVTTVSAGIRAAFHFIVDGVTYLFETLVDTVEKAFDLVEAVFSAVKVFFQQLYEWLAFLFNWGDMLRTHDAIAHIINSGFDFLIGATGGIQRIIDAGIDTLQHQLQQWFAEARNTIAGDYSLGGYERSNTPDDPDTSKAVANNIVYNGLVNNASAAHSSMAATALLSAADGPLRQFMDELTQLADFTESSQAFAQALAYLQDLGSAPDEIFRKLLAALMSVVEGVLQAVLSGVQAVIDALLKTVATLIAGLKQLMNAKWNIPFVSDLYRFITNGSDLTTLDLMALVLAVPGTILFKVMQNAAPFPDQASVSRFKAAFTADVLLSASGLKPASRQHAKQSVQAEQAWSGCLPRDLALVTGTLGSVAYFFYGSLTALGDALPPESGPPEIVAYAALILETAAQLCSCPWIFASGAPGCATAEGAGRVLWLYTCLGVVLDGVFVLTAHKMPENRDDIGVMATFVYGLGHLALAIRPSIGQSGEAVALNIVPCLPEVCKPLRLKRVVVSTEGFSLLGQAALDAICYTSATVLNMVSVSAATRPSLADASALGTGTRSL